MTYLTGKWGPYCKIVILPNKKRDGHDSDPDFKLCFAKHVKKEDLKKPAPAADPFGEKSSKPGVLGTDIPF